MKEITGYFVESKHIRKEVEDLLEILPTLKTDEIKMAIETMRDLILVNETFIANGVEK